MKKFTNRVLLCVAGICLGVVAFASPAYSAETTSGKVKIEEQKTVTTQKKATTVAPKGIPNYSAPYRLGNGKRDPFVPFGGNLAPATTVKTVLNTPVTIPGEKKTVATSPTKTTAVQTKSAPLAPTQAAVTELPVKVTGTMTSCGDACAILTSEAGGASYMVRPGDSIGEYTVKSIGSREVVLVWKGKSYVVPIKTPAGKTAPPAGKTNTGLPSPTSK